MESATIVLSGIEMGEDEYLESLSHSNRFEFTNGVVTARRGPYRTQKSHVAVAEEISAAFREYRKARGGFGGQTPTTNLVRARIASTGCQTSPTGRLDGVSATRSSTRRRPASRSFRQTRMSPTFGRSAGYIEREVPTCAG